MAPLRERLAVGRKAALPMAVQRALPVDRHRAGRHMRVYRVATQRGWAAGETGDIS